MKRLALSMVFLSVVAMTGCALHIPGPFYHEDYYPVTVLLDIEPDDAEVYLDGRLIGKAYEFSTSIRPWDLLLRKRFRSRPWVRIRPVHEKRNRRPHRLRRSRDQAGGGEEVDRLNAV